MSLIKTSFVIIENTKGEVALVLEGGRAKGLWCLPGGHIDENESLEEAALREAKEESGLDVEIVGKITSMRMSGLEYLGKRAEDDEVIEVNIFKAKPLSFALKPGIQELDACWFTKAEIEKLDLRWKFLSELLIEST